MVRSKRVPKNTHTHKKTNSLQHSALAMRATASGAHRVWHDGRTPRTR